LNRPNGDAGLVVHAGERLPELMQSEAITDGTLVTTLAFFIRTVPAIQLGAKREALHNAQHMKIGTAILRREDELSSGNAGGGVSEARPESLEWE
jgi:hypothetical protein